MQMVFNISTASNLSVFSDWHSNISDNKLQRLFQTDTPTLCWPEQGEQKDRILSATFSSISRLRNNKYFCPQKWTSFFKRQKKMLSGCPLLWREDDIDLSCCPLGHSWEVPRDIKLRLLRRCQDCYDYDYVPLESLIQRSQFSLRGWLLK